MNNPPNTFKIYDDGKLKTSELLAKCKEKFKCWMYWEDDRLDEEFPRPENPIVRYFNKTQEPDPETMGKSSDVIDPLGIKSCTLREYMMMQSMYFEETGKFLDMKNFTLCIGSPAQNGDIVFGGWNPAYREVYFCPVLSSDLDKCLGSRLAISAPQ